MPAPAQGSHHEEQQRERQRVGHQHQTVEDRDGVGESSGSVQRAVRDGEDQEEHRDVCRPGSAEACHG
ncbi:hypothetical protein ACWFMI_04480 [Nocardiopsis terrae]